MPSNPKAKKANYGYIREAYMVRRYHTVGHVASQETVGHHTVNVLAIIFHLFDDHPPLYLIRHALHHDVPELATGDVPATAKWAHPPIAEALAHVESKVAENHGLTIHPLTGEEEALMKFADMMDLCFKSVEEIMAGNETFVPILSRGMSFVKTLLENQLKDKPQAHELWEILKSNRFIDLEMIDAPTLKSYGITSH